MFFQQNKYISYIFYVMFTMDFEKKEIDTSDNKILNKGAFEKKRQSIDSILTLQKLQFRWGLANLDVISLVGYILCKIVKCISLTLLDTHNV